MDGIDPEVLLEWLQTGIGDERDLQLMALEQLCMLLLMADNIDRCFESCPPRTFIPALCKIFLDETAPDNVLEVTARAITYYLDESNECTRRITQVEGAVKAICTRLAAAEMSDRASKDLAEQCVKLLEKMCQRETMTVYDAGGINAMLAVLRRHGSQVNEDTMRSAMSMVTILCEILEPACPELTNCVESLGALLEHDDAKVSKSALRCFAALTDRFIRKRIDTAELAVHSNLVEHLLLTLAKTNDENSNVSSNFLSIVLSLLINLCRGSSVVTERVLSSNSMIKGILAVLTNKEERVVTGGLRLADVLIVFLCEGRVHRHTINAIRQKDSKSLESDNSKTKKEEVVKSETTTVSKTKLPNPALVKKVLHQLLPIFCEIFQKSLNTSVRRTSLSLLRKIVENIGDLKEADGGNKQEIGNKERKMSADVSAGAESLVSVVVSVLDQEEDFEGHEQVLLILQSLLEKDAELWVMELIRLGVFERVEAMAEEPPKGLEQILNEVIEKTATERGSTSKKTSLSSQAMDIDVVVGNEPIATSSSASIGGSAEITTADLTWATQTPPPTVEMGTSSSSASSAILQVVSKLSAGVTSEKSSDKKGHQTIKSQLNTGCAYRWKEWRIVKGSTALFIWSDVVLIELPFQSNGWFRYLADNDSYVQFLSGIATVEEQMSEEEKRKEVFDLITRWKTVKGVFNNDSSAVPISVLGIPSNSKKVSQKLEVPAWEISSIRSSEIQIKSTSPSSPNNQPNNMTTTVKVQDDSGGFIFESGSGRRVTVMPETALPTEFHTGWSSHGVSTRKIKFRIEIQKRKVQKLAWKLWNNLKEAQKKMKDEEEKDDEINYYIWVKVKGHPYHQKVISESDGTVSETTLRGAFRLNKDINVTLCRKEAALKRIETSSGFAFYLGSSWVGKEYEILWEGVNNSQTAMSRVPSPMEIDAIDGSFDFKRINEMWEDRLFSIIGRKYQGTAVLLSHQKIVTASHLSFRKGEKYALAGPGRKIFSAICEFISTKLDYAILSAPDLPMVEMRIGQLDRSQQFIVLGFPDGSANKTPAVNVGQVEGFASDERHLIGVPGSRPGFSGSAVLNSTGFLAGILIGSIFSIETSSSIHEWLRSSCIRPCTKILPTVLMKFDYEGGCSNEES